MKFYRFWKRCEREMPDPDGTGILQRVTVYGHSDLSPADAAACGNALLAEVERRRAGEISKWEYDIGGRPIREEVLLTLTPQDVVTRNHYGAEVLNTTRHCFIDIDGDLPGDDSLLGILGAIFGGRKDDQKALRHVERLARLAGYDGPVRVYRTKAGFRLLLPDCPIEPNQCAALMQAFHADPRYAALCRVQECWRARLTPKPYRIRMDKRRFEWPQEDPAILAQQALWLQDYRARSERRAVCRYLGTVNGPEGPTGDVAIDYHDEQTRIDSALPLA